MTIDVALLGVAAASSLAAAGLSLYNQVQINRVHAVMNSRLDQLLLTSTVAAEARGLKQGREERRDA